MLQKFNKKEISKKLILSFEILLSLAGIHFWAKQIKQGNTDHLIFHEWKLYTSIFFLSIACSCVLMLTASIKNINNINHHSDQSNINHVPLSLFVPAFTYILIDLSFPLQLYDRIPLNIFTSSKIFDFWLIAACIAINFYGLLRNQPDRFISTLGVIFPLTLISVKIFPPYPQAFTFGAIQSGLLAIPNIINVLLLSFTLIAVIDNKSKPSRSGLKTCVALYLITLLTALISDRYDYSIMGLKWGYFLYSDSFISIVTLAAIIPLALAMSLEKTSSKIPAAFMILTLISLVSMRYPVLSSIDNYLRHTLFSNFDQSRHFEEIIVIAGFISTGLLAHQILTRTVLKESGRSAQQSSTCGISNTGLPHTEGSSTYETETSSQASKP